MPFLIISPPKGAVSQSGKADTIFLGDFVLTMAVIPWSISALCLYWTTSSSGKAKSSVSYSIILWKSNRNDTEPMLGKKKWRTGRGIWTGNIQRENIFLLWTNKLLSHYIMLMWLVGSDGMSHAICTTL